VKYKVMSVEHWGQW